MAKSKKDIKPKAKPKEGRPSLYKPEYCKQVISHMEEGLSFESFAGFIGVNRDTIYEWTKKHKEFSDAKKVGFEKSRLTWERIGLRIARIGEGNPTAFIFNMKNRFKEEWRDKVESDNNNTNTNYNSTPLTPGKIKEINKALEDEY